MTLRQNIIVTSAPASVILIRLVVGGIFLSEGIQKFLYPAENGVGRFTKIGIPRLKSWALSSVSLKSSVARSF